VLKPLLLSHHPRNQSKQCSGNATGMTFGNITLIYSLAQEQFLCQKDAILFISTTEKGQGILGATKQYHQ
jgi:hypothetical protein